MAQNLKTIKRIYNSRIQVSTHHVRRQSPGDCPHHTRAFSSGWVACLEGKSHSSLLNSSLFLVNCPSNLTKIHRLLLIIIIIISIIIIIIIVITSRTRGTMLLSIAFTAFLYFYRSWMRISVAERGAGVVLLTAMEYSNDMRG